MTRRRVGRAALWATAGFLLGAAALAGSESDEDLREKLLEIERLCGELRALASEGGEFPAIVNAQGYALDRVPLPDLAAGVTEYTRPRPWPRDTAIMHSGPDAEVLQAYGTIEEILELVRCNVRPDVWESGGQLTPVGSALVVFAPPDVNRAVRAFIDTTLRPPARLTVHLQIEIAEAEGPLGATLAAATGGSLDAALRTELEEAVGAGKARILFRGSVRALSRQQVVLWHGAQVAVASDAEVEVGIRSDATDPVVSVELLGTILEVRSTVSDEPGRVQVEMEIERAALNLPVRTVKTEKTGTLQMPSRVAMPVCVNLPADVERWTVAASGAGPDGKRRLVIVRPTVITGGGR